MSQIAEIIQLSREKKFLPNLQKHQQYAMILLSVNSPEKLCRLLKTPMPYLEEIINAPVYKHYTVKKKRGGERHIFAPDKSLKDIQKRLNYFLQAYYLWIKPNEVHGFVINPRYLGVHCNIVENAKVHTGKKHVLNIDLKDFFPNISAKRIKNLFTSHLFNYNEQIAIALTLLQHTNPNSRQVHQHRRFCQILFVIIWMQTCGIFVRKTHYSFHAMPTT